MDKGKRRGEKTRMVVMKTMKGIYAHLQISKKATLMSHDEEKDAV